MTGFKTSLRQAIEAFMQQRGMSRTRFGEAALGDPSFITVFSHGRPPRLDTADRLLAFMGLEPIGLGFRREVDAFLAVTGAKSSELGREMSGNPSFVSWLRRGGSPPPALGSGNAFADLPSLGHDLMNATLSATASLMGAAAGSGLHEFVPFVGKCPDMFESFWQVADVFVSTVLRLMLIAGAVLAYVLPALPFIRFLFAILGWIVTVAVPVLAVTVFAAVHVTRGDSNRLANMPHGWAGCSCPG